MANLVKSRRVRRLGLGRAKFLSLTQEQQKELIQNNTLGRIVIDFGFGIRFALERANLLGVSFKKYVRLGRQKILK